MDVSPRISPSGSLTPRGSGTIGRPHRAHGSRGTDRPIEPLAEEVGRTSAFAPGVTPLGFGISRRHRAGGVQGSKKFFCQCPWHPGDGQPLSAARRRTVSSRRQPAWHWRQGKLAARVQERGHALAAEGIATLIVDAAGSGERAEVERE